MERVRVVELNEVSLERRLSAGLGPQRFAVHGARRVVVTWNGPAAGRVVARLAFAGTSESETFVLAEPDPERRSQRRSVSRADRYAELAVDELRSALPLDSIALEAAGDLGWIAVAASTRAHGTPYRPGFEATSGAERAEAISLDVAARSQYEERARSTDDPAFVKTERGWCAPASLAMLLERAGTARSTRDVALAVFDRAFGGTGNWSFGAGFAGRYGFAAVAYLRDLAHARSFITEGFALALSFSWKSGELPGAPLESSAGHLAVLRGFDTAGDPRFADPAQPSRLATYDYRAFERAWLAHGGVAVLVAPSKDAERAVALANAAAST